MALAKTDDSIIEIEGRIGGDIWRYDDSGQHVYAHTTGTSKQPSDLQLKRRKAFIECVNFWKEHITLEHILQWENYAQSHESTNRKGEPIILTAYQMFMHINIYRAYNDVELLLSPPSD